MIGHKFTRLTVIEECGRSKSGELLWKCRCDCGKILNVPGRALRAGTTKSCGCYKVQLATERCTKHSLYYNPLYKTWVNMKGRCTCPTNKSYKYYGGRGISLCDEWYDSPKAFYEWAVTHGWSKGLTIDRVDVNGPYSPENCRWATRAEQSNNMTTNHLLTYKGKTLNLTQWAKELGIPVARLSYRINHGWTIERAFTYDNSRKVSAEEQAKD